ncbi:MAG: MoaD/ThiS family protein [Planctomycetes bacterium]|nr:MoaD/ThiS family protein [Planctomycetota bacterium]MBI3845348.1 MoaD/ThiS family protein [Planctomycetota bacterium]
MKIRVRLFAMYREALGRGEVELDLADGTTAAQVFDRLFAGTAYEKLPRRTTLYAINQTYQPPATMLRDGDEVAFIPPVAGGLA